MLCPKPIDIHAESNLQLTREIRPTRKRKRLWRDVYNLLKLYDKLIILE